MDYFILLSMEKFWNFMNIITCYYKHKPGGLCKRLYRGIFTLLRSGHTVHYISVLPFPVKHEKLIHHKIYYPFKNNESLLFWCYFISVSPILSIWICYKFKIERAFVFAPLYGFILQPCRIILSIPLIVFLRADSVRNHEFKLRSKFIVLIESLFEGLGIWRVKLVSVSNNTLQSVIARHSCLKPRGKIVLYNDIKFLNKVSKQIDANAIHIACVGVVEPRKNHIFVLKALKQVGKKNIFVNIYGEGSSLAALKDFVEKNELNHNVLMHGWVDMEQGWDKVDLLILPSLHEGVSNAILEAGSRGIPVLASNIPEHREILPCEDLFSISEMSDLVAKFNLISSNASLYLNDIAIRQRHYFSKLNFNWDEKFSEIILN